MKSKSEMKCLYFWVKISIFIKKIIQTFVIRQVKFLKFTVFIYLLLHLMLHYSTYVYHVVFTYKTCQNIFFSFFFASKTDFFIFRYILGNACFAISYISGHFHTMQMAYM